MARRLRRIAATRTPVCHPGSANDSRHRPVAWDADAVVVAITGVQALGQVLLAASNLPATRALKSAGRRACVLVPPSERATRRARPPGTCGLLIATLGGFMTTRTPGQAPPGLAFPDDSSPGQPGGRCRHRRGRESAPLTAKVPGLLTLDDAAAQILAAAEKPGHARSAPVTTEKAVPGPET